MVIEDGGKWLTNFTVEQWGEELCSYARTRLILLPGAPVNSWMLAFLELEPENVISGEGNLLLNEGIAQMIGLLIGDVVSGVFDNANARIGVGDSSVAAAPTQSDLQAATNKLYKGMNMGFPHTLNQSVSFQADFTSDEANFAWNEWVVDNGAGIALNRKVVPIGTKLTGTWTLTVTVTIS